MGKEGNGRKEEEGEEEEEGERDGDRVRGGRKVEGSWQRAPLAHAFPRWLPRQRGRCLETPQTPVCHPQTRARSCARAPASRGGETIKQSRAELERVDAHPPGTPALRGYKYCTRHPFSSRGAPSGLGPVTSCAVWPFPPTKTKGP